jgi:hypothetical protein
MGDRCYMSVTCRRSDQARFEELGFVLEFEQSPEGLVIEMVDQEANYAHSAGTNYGGGKIACDGRKYAAVAASQDGFVVEWDYKKMKPKPSSVLTIRQYLAVHQRAEQILTRLKQKEPHEHVFSRHSKLCDYCGIHAEDDAVEN